MTTLGSGKCAKPEYECYYECYECYEYECYHEYECYYVKGQKDASWECSYGTTKGSNPLPSPHICQEYQQLHGSITCSGRMQHILMSQFIMHAYCMRWLPCQAQTHVLDQFAFLQLQRWLLTRVHALPLVQQCTATGAGPEVAAYTGAGTASSAAGARTGAVAAACRKAATRSPQEQARTLARQQRWRSPRSAAFCCCGRVAGGLSRRWRHVCWLGLQSLRWRWRSHLVC